jgi:hypothetical protein
VLITVRYGEPVPFRKLFLSRWSALLWAIGILWTAVDTVGFAPPAGHGDATAAANATDATGAAIDNADLAILANAMKGN